MTSAETQYVARVLRALEVLAAEPRSEADFARALGVHARTAHRLLMRLVDEGYVAADSADNKTYVLTLKILVVAGRVMDRTDLVQTAAPFVARLQGATGELAHLCIPMETSVVHLLHQTGEREVIVKPKLGEAPYHSTAVGKALLAHLPERCERVLAGPLERFTRHTILDPTELRAEFARIREQGFAVDDQENSLDLRCVAAPVFDHSGSAIAGLGISAPALRLSIGDSPAVIAAVVEIAEALSLALGFSRDHRGFRLGDTDEQQNLDAPRSTLPLTHEAAAPSG